MVNLKKRVITWVIVILLLFSTSIMDTLPRDIVPEIVRHIWDIYESVIHFGLITYWTWRVLTRFQKGATRQLFALIALLIYMFLVVKNIKWYIASDDDYALIRYCWYLMYVPMLGIPLCSFYVAMLLNKPDDAKLPKGMHLVTIITVALGILVLTNDLHQQVFYFKGPGPHYDTNYSYHWGYYAVFGWIGVLMISFIVRLIRGCRLEKKLSLYTPLIPMILATIYAVLYAFGIKLRGADITTTFSIATVATLELAMYAGLIRINTGYEEIFKESKINAVIMDEEYNVKYKSKNALPLTDEMLRESANHQIKYDKNTVVRSHKLEFGTVVWTEDITKYNEYLEELIANKTALQDQLALEQENYDTRDRLNAIAEQNRIMDTLIKENAQKLEKAKNLLDSVDVNSPHSEKRAHLGYASLITTYIKRKSNLVLLSMNHGHISSDELRLSIEESLMTLNIRGVEYATNFTSDIDLTKDDVFKCFDLYEEVVESSVFDISHVMVKLRQVGETVKFTITAVSSKPLGEIKGIDPISEDDEYTYSIVLEGEKYA